MFRNDGNFSIMTFYRITLSSESESLFEIFKIIRIRIVGFFVAIWVGRAEIVERSRWFFCPLTHWVILTRKKLSPSHLLIAALKYFQRPANDLRSKFLKNLAAQHYLSFSKNSIFYRYLRVYSSRIWNILIYFQQLLIFRKIENFFSYRLIFFFEFLWFTHFAEYLKSSLDFFSSKWTAGVLITSSWSFAGQIDPGNETLVTFHCVNERWIIIQPSVGQNDIRNFHLAADSFHFIHSNGRRWRDTLCISYRSPNHT